jgi:membrane-associated phospholipid phosphatase
MGRVKEQKINHLERKSPHLVRRTLSEIDYDIGFAVYYNAQRSVSRHLATIVSLCFGEELWIPTPLLLAFFRWMTDLYAPQLEYLFFGWTVPRLLELYSDAILVIAGNCITKLLFRRLRPTYAEQDPFYLLSGDFFSFPSGHAFWSSFLLTRVAVLLVLDGHSALVCGVVHVVLLFAVCWSRVAKGRHYPADTICGALLGGVLALAVLIRGNEWWSRVKVLIFAWNIAEWQVLLVWHRNRTLGFTTLGWAGVFGLATMPYKTTLPLGDQTEVVTFTAAAIITIQLLFVQRVDQSRVFQFVWPSTTTMRAHSQRRKLRTA